MRHFRAVLRIVLVTVYTLILVTVWAVVGLYRNRTVAGTVSWRHAITGRWARGVLWLMGGRLQVHGTAPDPPFCLVANHLGYMDILVVIASVRGRLVSRADLAHWPGIGWLARTFGTIFIDRSRIRDIPRVAAEMRTVVEEGDGVVFFPEGTSSSGDDVLPFKPPLMAVPAGMDMPVHVASIGYELPGGDARLDIAWWGEMTFADHLYALLTRRHFNASIHFGRESVPHADRKQLAVEAHQAVTELHRPLTDITSP